MGVHYSRYGTADTQSEDCDKYFFGQLVYYQGILNEFQWIHPFKTSASGVNLSPWELITEGIIRVVTTDNPPKCYLGQDGLLVNPGIFSQHIYLRDWTKITCQ